MSGDYWVTPQELADELRVSRSTIYEWAATGRGPLWSRFGRSIRFRRSAVEAWFTAQEQNTERAS